MKSEPLLDACELLAAQHAEVDKLIAGIEGSKDPDERVRLFDDLANALAAHAAIEEKLFYPAVNTDKTRDLVLESVEEHLQIKRMLADMMELDVESEHFVAKLSVLKEEVSHHAHDEEETELFPKVRRELDADQLAALGNEMLVKFEELMAGQPRLNIPAETDAAAPI